MIYCVTGKVIHQSRHAALRAVSRLGSGSAYRCRSCGGYHHTSWVNNKPRVARIGKVNWI